MGGEPGTQLWSRRTKLVRGTHPAFCGGPAVLQGQSKKPLSTCGRTRHNGVPGPHLCRNHLTAKRPAQHKCRPGSLGKRNAICCSGYEAGRRRAIGVVAAPSINPRAAAPMVRRWVDGTPKRPCGPEGRGHGHGRVGTRYPEPHKSGDLPHGRVPDRLRAGSVTRWGPPASPETGRSRSSSRCPIRGRARRGGW